MKKLLSALMITCCAFMLVSATVPSFAFAAPGDDAEQGQVLDGTTDETQGDVMPIAETPDADSAVAEDTEEAEAEANQETQEQDAENADQPVEDAQQQTNFSDVVQEIDNFIHSDSYMEANSVDKNIMVDTLMQNLYAEGKIQSYYQNSGTFGYVTSNGVEGFVDVGTDDSEETFTHEDGIEPRGTDAEVGYVIDGWVIALIVAAVVVAGIVVTVVVAKKRGSAFSVDDQAPLANGSYAAHISQNDAEEDEDPDDFGDRTPME